MIYGCILFELGEYESVKIIQDEVVDSIIAIICSNEFVRYKETDKKKLMGENLWRKLLVSIMVNLSSSIHSKNYENISELYKLFASAVRDSSRLESMTFRKCITYVLDSIGVILNEHTDVMNEVEEISCYFFSKLKVKAKERDAAAEVANEKGLKLVNEEEEESHEMEVVDTTLSRSFYTAKVSRVATPLLKEAESKTDVLNVSGSKQRMKLLRSFV